MPSPFPHPRTGTEIAENIGGFPLYFRERQPRIVTADIWDLLRNLVDGRLVVEKRQACKAYIQQAQEFYEAASNPRTASRPLLYYYCFLNLAKMAVLSERIEIPNAVYHGISDPQRNVRKKLRLQGQKIKLHKRDPNHNQLAAEFIHILGGTIPQNTEIRVIDVLSQIPGIHRAFCRVEKCGPKFLPIKSVKILHDNASVWANLVFDRHDRDVTTTLPAIRISQRFRRHLTQVGANNTNELCFETAPFPGRYRKGVDNAMRNISKDMREIGVWTILTPTGYRYYFSTIKPRKVLPQLAAIYSTVFYFGSITRYRPQDYERILGGDYLWVVGEFFATQPAQFLYYLASFMAGTEVIRPHMQTT